MTYDLLIKDARICDGAGNPVFHGAVGVRGGKIVWAARSSLISGIGCMWCGSSRSAINVT
jgi:N-acyl-D-aspartate/D-glutamate deacylase